MLVYDPATGQMFYSNKELLEKAVKELNTRLKEERLDHICEWVFANDEDREIFKAYNDTDC